MSVIIRNARPGDIPALIDLAVETFLDSFGDYHTPENCRTFIKESHNRDVYSKAIIDSAQFLLIAENEGKLLSYLYAKPTTLPVGKTLEDAHELSKIYSCRSEQSHGFGTKLLKAWEVWANDQGYENVVLGVWSENEAAQRFYIRHGYTKVSEYKLSVGDVQDTDYIYHKSLKMPAIGV